MKSRVSMRLPPRLKVFASTVPLGKSKSPEACTVMVVPSGMAKARCLLAPSLQSAALTSKGMSEATGTRGSLAWKHPVCDSSRGKVSGGCTPLGTSL